MKKFLFIPLCIFYSMYTIAQNQPPVAVNDTITGFMCGDEIVIDAITNDYDPDGDNIEVFETDDEVWYADILIVDNQIVFSPIVVVNEETAIIEYRIRETDDHESISDWASILIIFIQNPEFPILVTDSVEVLAGYPVIIDVLANDLLDGLVNDTLIGFYSENDINICSVTDDNKVLFQSFMTDSGVVQITYYLNESKYIPISYGSIVINILGNHSLDSLTINNINAGIHSDGMLFNRDIHNYQWWEDDPPHFEYPIGSGKHTIYTSSLWIGGIDQDDSLHVAAQRYKQVGIDFQFGPVSNNYEGEEFFKKYSRLWKLDNEDINFHRNNYWKEGYEPIAEISTWPGNGNVENGQAEQLAPFYDKNEDGLYEPMDGDYPLIRGDQSIFFIYNDDRIHGETKGKKLQIELHGMAYAFNQPGDTVLNNTIFIHYDIFNRSGNTYYNTYVGSWTDIDLGDNRDDYVGCHVGLSSFIGYNGDSIDGNGEPNSYGENPPAQSITFLAGPFMDDDNLDNPDGGCDYSVNGLNFGDGVVDNERLGMTNFIFHNNSNSGSGDPAVYKDYYNYMTSLWRDDTHVQYGGNGHITGAGTVGPECRFMFPGASDPCNWGTDGQLPNGGYNQNGKYWSEETGDNGQPNPPNDRRGLGAAGPFTFKPGDRQELELAFSVAQGNNGPLSSVEQLYTNLENLFQRIENGEIIIPSDQLSVDEIEGDTFKMKLFPNPVLDKLYIEVEGEPHESLNYRIYNNLGYQLISGKIKTGTKHAIDVQKLEKGFYILNIITDDGMQSSRFIKM